MQQRMNFQELINFFNSLTENGLRTSKWIQALEDGSITRSFEGQTFTVQPLEHHMFEVTFK